MVRYNNVFSIYVYFDKKETGPLLGHPLPARIYSLYAKYFNQKIKMEPPQL